MSSIYLTKQNDVIRFIGEDNMKRVLTYTTAEDYYDGFGTKTIKPLAGISIRTGKNIRLVSTPAEHVDWQRIRYLSGLHLALDEQRWQEWITAGLVK